MKTNTLVLVIDHVQMILFLATTHVYVVWLYPKNVITVGPSLLGYSVIYYIHEACVYTAFTIHVWRLWFQLIKPNKQREWLPC